MLHALNPEVALDAGVNAALLLHYIASPNCRETIPKRVLDGRDWVCLPIKQLAPAFPYLSPATITRALAALEATGYLLRANLNRASFDRTYWYALTDKALGAEPQPPEPQPEQQCLLPPVAKPTRLPRAAPAAPDFNPALFQRFWQAYPRKVNKAHAMQAWTKLHVDEQLFERIMDGLRRNIQFDRTFREKEYTPYPASWLNGKRWEDEFDTPAPTAPPRNTAFDELRQLAQEPGTLPPGR